MYIFKADLVKKCVYYFKTPIFINDIKTILFWKNAVEHDDEIFDLMKAEFAIFGIDLLSLTFENEQQEEEPSLVDGVNEVSVVVYNDSNDKATYYETKTHIIDSNPKRRDEPIWYSNLDTYIEVPKGAILLENFPFIYDSKTWDGEKLNEPDHTFDGDKIYVQSMDKNPYFNDETNQIDAQGENYNDDDNDAPNDDSNVNNDEVTNGDDDDIDMEEYVLCVRKDQVDDMDWKEDLKRKSSFQGDENRKLEILEQNSVILKQFQQLDVNRPSTSFQDKILQMDAAYCESRITRSKAALYDGQGKKKMVEDFNVEEVQRIHVVGKSKFKRLKLVDEDYRVIRSGNIVTYCRNTVPQDALERFVRKFKKKE